MPNYDSTEQLGVSCLQTAKTADAVQQLLASLDVKVPVVENFLSALNKAATHEIKILGIKFENMSELLAAFSNLASVAGAIQDSVKK